MSSLRPSLSRNKGQTNEAIAFALAMKPIFDQMGLSRYSAHTAAKKLNEAGIMSYSGRPWSSQTVLRTRRRIDPTYQPGPRSYRFRPRP
jgi:hypothetical protein